MTTSTTMTMSLMMTTSTTMTMSLMMTTSTTMMSLMKNLLKKAYLEKKIKKDNFLGRL
ncbi:hypothetical protein [Carnobacterium maltaromaticum]|uniref:hypothetical protein n=1 Tax=Carnobacterium maltaromaticum TaxID=2751 RepID=UPI001C4E1AC8|nr:hypothetical protein [Carnobacterium maltaromaticum]